VIISVIQDHSCIRKNLTAASAYIRRYGHLFPLVASMHIGSSYTDCGKKHILPVHEVLWWRQGNGGPK